MMPSLPPLPPRLRALLFPALALALCAAAWRSYGWQGLVLAALMISFWVLLHFTKLMRLLRAAAARPMGAVVDVPALQNRLRLGMPLHEVIRLTGCLGDRLDGAPGEPGSGATVGVQEQFAWSDAQGRCLRLGFAHGRLSHIERQDTTPTHPQVQAASDDSAAQP